MKEIQRFKLESDFHLNCRCVFCLARLGALREENVLYEPRKKRVCISCAEEISRIVKEKTDA